MIELIQTTDALLVISVQAPACEAEIPDYEPSFLLSVAGLDARIVGHFDFASACEWGFNWYFSEMFNPDDTYTHRYYTLAEVLDDVSHNILAHFTMNEECAFESRVGCVLGRLSALVLYQPDIAATAYQSLLSLVRVTVQQNYVHPGRR